MSLMPPVHSQPQARDRPVTRRRGRSSPCQALLQAQHMASPSLMPAPHCTRDHVSRFRRMLSRRHHSMAQDETKGDEQHPACDRHLGEDEVSERGSPGADQKR